jgi:hypothetical protein
MSVFSGMAAKLLPLMRQTLTVRAARVEANGPMGVEFTQGVVIVNAVRCSRQRIRKSYRAVQVTDGSSQDVQDAIIMVAFDAQLFAPGLEFFVDEPDIAGFVQEQWFLQSPVIDSGGQGVFMRLEVTSARPV